MPLVPTINLVENAAVKGYAVPAFNVYNYETVIAALNTASRLNAPVILQIYNRLMDSRLAKGLASAISTLAKDEPVSISLHLDHGESISNVIRAIRYGFCSAMYDGSNLSFKDNIKTTSKIKELCQHVNMPVEGELGHVGTTNENINSSEFTDPELAKVFCEETGVDMLAVMVGSAHGRYKKAPELDIDRIAAIRGKTNKPLVLHGGSGIPDEQIKKAISAGITKINFATDICVAFIGEIRSLPCDSGLWEKPIDIFAEKSIKAVESFMEEKILLLGAENRS